MKAWERAKDLAEELDKIPTQWMNMAAKRNLGLKRLRSQGEPW